MFFLPLCFELNFYIISFVLKKHSPKNNDCHKNYQISNIGRIHFQGVYKKIHIKKTFFIYGAKYSVSKLH